MAYLGSWKIDDYLPIPVTTHKFSTGAAFAPTSLTYSIYEDATATGLDEDVDMVVASPFDSVVGFYLARRQLTAAAGFEKGKNYTVLVKATVDGVAAIAAHTFQIEAEVDANVVSGTVGTVTNLTNLPAVTTDWLTAAGVKADAVTKIQSGLALEATLTAIKGAGWSTETLAAIDVLIDAIKAKTDTITAAPSAATVADAVWNEALSGHTTTGTAGDTLADIDVSGVATAVWAASTRTLTQSAASVTATVSGSDITCTRGDSLSASLTDVGALTGYSKVYFTVKRDHDDADAVSIIQIEKTAGLKYIDGAAAVTSANGSITITDEATGDITIALDEAETAKLDAGVYYYDVQIVRTAGTVSTLTTGEFTVSADVTRATT